MNLCRVSTFNGNGGRGGAGTPRRFVDLSRRDSRREALTSRFVVDTE